MKTPCVVIDWKGLWFSFRIGPLKFRHIYRLGRGISSLRPFKDIGRWRGVALILAEGEEARSFAPPVYTAAVSKWPSRRPKKQTYNLVGGGDQPLGIPTHRLVGGEIQPIQKGLPPDLVIDGEVQPRKH